MSFLMDSLVNFVTGMGLGKDKSAQTQYGFNIIDRSQLDFAYRGDWVARKVVNIPAQDSTREWRQWQAPATDIEKIEAEEKRLGLQRKVKLAMIKARLYGGAGLILGTGDTDPSLPLNADSIGEGGLKYVHVVSRYDIASGLLNLDLMSEYYGQPEYYEIRSVAGRPAVRMHPSRMVRFIGNELPDPLMTVDGGWGDSILQVLDDAIKNVGLTTQSAAILVNEAKIDVINIPNLMQNISTKDYKDRLTERMTLANTSKSLLSTLLLDGEEKWNRNVQTFTGLPDILKLYLTIACGAADIPDTRFIGQSKGGLGANGEENTRNYYDMISSEQNTELTPTLTPLDEVLIRSATGKRDKSTFFEWNPLWQMDEVQKATIGYQKAQAFKIDVDAGLISQEALREGRENQLIEDGVYPGFETALESAPENEPLDENNPNVQAQNAARNGQPPDPNAKVPPSAANSNSSAVSHKINVTINSGGSKDSYTKDEVAALLAKFAQDAEPRSLYVRRDVLNKRDIAEWAASVGLKDVLPDLHVTLIYSKAAVDWMKVGQDWYQDDKGELKVAPGGARMLDLFGPNDSKDTLVLMFNSSALCCRNRCIRDETGASFDYDEYQPHVSITKTIPDGVDVTKLEPYRGQILLGPEIFEEMK